MALEGNNEEQYWIASLIEVRYLIEVKFLQRNYILDEGTL